MQLNEATIKGKWSEIKGEIQKSWGRLSGEEIDRAKGNLNSLYASVQREYGQKQEDVENKIHEIVEKFGDKMEKDVDSAKSTMSSNKESVARIEQDGGPT